ncbi:MULTISPECIES: hypothetical protein [unclassified Mucilaginibacter]|uniref:hypothetical protein n=1 Tax=unclassified Mucilaginibacter TaxID=2617802 RepID=UPI002AC946FF|nr:MULTISPECIES: hypothetical protein [unclassified Mucilaginibacter]MEB0264008.1 hypothetical protein [Mucilaginibacter sp. 10I4]MEB0278540.1 hypothetical protein [Mucilaginibacter sp. 10B2]MEB0299251.1 hypothetical protein [Mucilaginibacter sp. 5C4]WPX23504.1 hypothetical protein RHM67_19710 [Mucilaginibacter sp. 5C4]
MPEYKLSAEGNAKLKKTWTYTILASYIVIIAIFAFNLLYRGGSTTNIITFAIIFMALIAGFVYGQKKYFKGIDATKLTINYEKIVLHTLNQPDVAINLADIKKVTHRGSNIFLVNKIPKKNSLTIINKFESFYEIEKLVNDAAEANNLQPTAI